MDDTKYHVEVFQVPIDKAGGFVTLLQILFLELIDEKKSFTSPVAVVKSKKIIDFSSKSTEQSPAQKRSASSDTSADHQQDPSSPYMKSKRRKTNSTLAVVPSETQTQASPK